MKRIKAVLERGTVVLLTAVLLGLTQPSLGTQNPTLDLDGGAIATGRFSYLTRLQIGNIDTAIESTREIRAEQIDDLATLRIETSSLTGMGETVDLLHLDAESLYPLTRLIIQGDGRMELDYAQDRVTGLIRAAGQLITVDLALAQPAYAGDAGLDTILGALPLREGLHGQLQAIETDVDVYVQGFHFVVDAAEWIETPAGRFKSWPIRIEAMDDPDYRQTLWMSLEPPRKFLQAQAPVPVEAGGGTLLTQPVLVENLLEPAGASSP